ncbi:IclR family transcriptional regulator [Haladaptatus halobius]|uniref:IclR family transcriptional regulator n=1 Tax=Haladaptatus halobius TaxID=2884875 RepID=UPI003F5D7FA1
MRQNLRVKSAGTMIQVIDAIKTLDNPTLSEIAKHVAIPKSTAHDHLTTLTKLELIVSTQSGYRIGARFLEYGGYARKNMRVYRVARPIVENLAAETGEHSNLGIEEHGRAVFLYKAEGEDAVTIDTHPGMRVPLHTTAMGKAIMAHRPRTEVEEIINKHGLTKVNENTITDRETLFEEFETIREQGYAIDNGERVERMRCVAVPIIGEEENVIAAVSVSGPMNRMNNERMKNDLPQRVKSAANVIEVNLKYSE